MKDSTSEITGLLQQWGRGDLDALDKLAPLVIDDLRRMARYYFARERSDHTLQPTALVCEFFVRVLGREKVQWSSRHQFFKAASKIMKEILIDSARRHKAGKRGGGQAEVPLDATPIPIRPLFEQVDVIALHEAMDRLEPRRRTLVELRFYFGLSHQQIGEELGLAEDTVKKLWRAVKAQLFCDLKSF